MKFDANGWLDEAIEVDYLNKSMDRQGYAIKYIVIHGTAGGNDAEAIAKFFRDGNRQASAHIIIDQQGKIAQGIPLSIAAWANGNLDPGHAPYLPEGINPNCYTASIEHVKSSSDNSDQLTSIQAQISFKVINAICNTYNIPKQPGDATGGIIKHSDITNTACPGPYPFDQLYAYLKGSSIGVLQGWSDDGQTLRGPNNEPVVLGFRDFVLDPKNNWDPSDWPLRPEYGDNPIEKSHPSLGGGTAQEFRLSRLCCTKARGVYKSWIGQELMWYQEK